MVAAAIAFSASAAGTLDDLEHSSLDVRFAVRGSDPDRRGPIPITIVGIDDRTRGDLPRFPFSRTYHAEVLRRLTALRARVVAYDVEFSEPSDDPDADDALVLAVGDAPRVVLAGLASADDGSTRVLGGVETQRRFGVRVGGVRVDVDGDGVLRRLAREHDRLKSFAVVTAERATGRPVEPSLFDRGRALIDWAGGEGIFPEVPFSILTERGRRRNASLPDRLVDGRPNPAKLNVRAEEAKLRGRIVIVGATAPSLKDVQTTPMDSGRQISGPEVQAGAVATVLRGVPLRDAWDPLGWLLTLLSAAAAPVVALRRGGFSTLLASSVGVVVVLAIAWVAFVANRVLPVAEPLLALGLGTLGAVAAGAAFEAVERQRTREIFSRFVSTDVVDDVLARTDDEVRLGGVRVDTTILFCDLRGSTTMLETLEPERGIAVLNRFLGAMSDCVDTHGGTLVGYRGDGLMAVFGAPLEQSDHADRAVACAREMVGPALERCHAALRADGLDHRLSMGVGVASGPVMAGNVGSERRMEYTAIGDAANVAARLEGLTKEHGQPVLVAAGTVERMHDRDGLDPLGPVPVRGRAGTVEVWATGLTAEPRPERDA
ncbi:adenylate/guanylate cyclase domain-containing protein [Patulibacter minatonensis]|uniref:adenylate/guanylate cyclase domain-containing protein n=1 Tax=Patulibacter minatonensis TaxID=298163 RepID=UPI00047A650D|nr:adenylate/guanylate cyclase domain-containing protein [Patulibacter minatonensis]